MQWLEPGWGFRSLAGGSGHCGVAPSDIPSTNILLSFSFKRCRFAYDSLLPERSDKPVQVELYLRYGLRVHLRILCKLSAAFILITLGKVEAGVARGREVCLSALSRRIFEIL